MSGKGWCGRFEGWNSLLIECSEPPVFAPGHFLNRGFAAESATAAIAQRAATEINHVRVAILRLDQVRMAGAMQLRIRTMSRAEDVGVGMQFVRPGKVSRTGKCHSVIEVRTAFGG